MLPVFRLCVRQGRQCHNVVISSTFKQPLSTTSHKVLVSQSDNIFENLALEDWLHEKADLENESILLMWRNKPVVVIGRHQNAWVESNVKALSDAGIPLARRRSGGGTVYHDEGNLNCSFLKKTSLYDRKQNLQLVVDAIKSRWDVNLTINKREDIVLDDQYKVSGTASRLSGKRTYHHFTLLYDLDKEKMANFLTSNMEGITSKATESVKSPVGTLKDQLLGVDFSGLVDVIADQFHNNPQERSIHFIDPLDDSMFPGIHKYYNELCAWDWVYGKTPPFDISRNFTKPIKNIQHTIGLIVGVKNGKVHGFKINIYDIAAVDARVFLILQVGLTDVRLRANDVLKALSQVKMEWIQQGLYTEKNHDELDWIILCVIETLGLC